MYTYKKMKLFRVYKSKKRNNNRKKVYQEVSDESEHSVINSNLTILNIVIFNSRQNNYLFVMRKIFINTVLKDLNACSLYNFYLRKSVDRKK